MQASWFIFIFFFVDDVFMQAVIKLPQQLVFLKQTKKMYSNTQC